MRSIVIVIVMCLAALLASASPAPAAQELSTDALKAITGGLPCFDSDHFCICDVYHSGCCSGSGCPHFDGFYIQFTPDDYWTCSNGGVWSAACYDNTPWACCIREIFYFTPCEGLPDARYIDTEGVCGVWRIHPAWAVSIPGTARIGDDGWRSSRHRSA